MSEKPLLTKNDWFTVDPAPVGLVNVLVVPGQAGFIIDTRGPFVNLPDGVNVEEIRVEQWRVLPSFMFRHPPSHRSV